MTANIRLRKGREKALLEGHPWIFSGAIENVDGQPEAGEMVRVVSSADQFLAWAAWSPQSSICARVWSRDDAAVIDRGFLREKLETALSLRIRLLPESTQPHAGFRVVHGESDGLPGFIIDRYGPVAVLQALTTGAERWKTEMAELLMDCLPIQAVYERSDADVRQLEGLPETRGWLAGSLGDDQAVIVEHGLEWQVDYIHGQKTGFYLDQRANRRRAGELAAERDVLNCFCYTGGFSLNALAGGARSVLSIDSSASSLAAARVNLQRNGLAADRAEWWEADVFQAMRGLRDRGRKFDLIILDPPKFAPTAAHAERAARAYKDINLLAFKLLNPGGLLMLLFGRDSRGSVPQNRRRRGSGCACGRDRARTTGAGH